MTASIEGTDPRTGTPTGLSVPESSVGNVDSALEAALRVFPEWSNAGVEARARALGHVADGIDHEAGDLAAIAERETGLGLERLTSEIRRTTTQLRLLAEAIGTDRSLRPMVEGPDPTRGVSRLIRFRVPRGVVGVFAASNFPFAFSVAGGDVASALAAGCPVVVKAHESHPATSDLTARIVTRALGEVGAPVAIFSVVHGRQAGVRVLTHPATSAVAFTGSLEAGRILEHLAAERPNPIPFFGEYGSVNPVVVLPEAAQASSGRLAQEYVESLTSGNGQMCTNPGLMFVPRRSPMLGEIRAAILRSRCGPLLNRRIFDAYMGHRGHGAETLLARGMTDGAAFSVPSEVYRVDLEEFVQDRTILTQERFGPSGLVVEYPGVNELVDVLPVLPGSLAAAVHAEHGDSHALAAVESAFRGRVGRLVLNGWPTGVSVSWAQHHGGPWPSTSNAEHTSVGVRSLDRWLVPMVYQNWTEDLVAATSAPCREPGWNQLVPE
jgi:NADP-dependent aldehyde dehydrogenase